MEEQFEVRRRVSQASKDMADARGYELLAKHPQIIADRSVGPVSTVPSTEGGESGLKRLIGRAKKPVVTEEKEEINTAKQVKRGEARMRAKDMKEYFKSIDASIYTPDMLKPGLPSGRGIGKGIGKGMKEDLTKQLGRVNEGLISVPKTISMTSSKRDVLMKQKEDIERQLSMMQLEPKKKKTLKKEEVNVVAKTDKRKIRGERIRAIMKERGVSLAEASKLLKSM